MDEKNSFLDLLSQVSIHYWKFCIGQYFQMCEEERKKETEKETYARKKQRQLKRLRRELDIACPPGGFDTGHAVWQDYMSY